MTSTRTGDRNAWLGTDGLLADENLEAAALRAAASRQSRIDFANYCETRSPAVKADQAWCLK